MKDQGFNSCELIWQELLSALSTQKKVNCHYLFVSAKTKTNDQWWFWELNENGRHRGPKFAMRGTDIISWFHVFEIWIQDFILVIYSSSNLRKICQRYKWLSLCVSLNHSVKRLIQNFNSFSNEKSEWVIESFTQPTHFKIHSGTKHTNACCSEMCNASALTLFGTVTLAYISNWQYCA